MAEIDLIGLIILALNGIVSYQGFKSHAFMDAYAFEVDKILLGKDYKRLVTSGFLHVGWIHLLFNMMTFYCFCSVLENTFGELNFLLLYFGSLIGGNLFSLFIHRNHGDYSAVGASGAISGMIFACIAVFPGMQIGFLGLPFYMPAWLYGLLYVLYSIYGIHSQRDNIGHDAHLGGGLVGLLIALAMSPHALEVNPWPIALIVVPSVIFIYLIITKPQWLLVDNLFKKTKGAYTLEDKYNTARRERELELDKLLDKISQKGMDSLTAKEKEQLKQFSDRK